MYYDEFELQTLLYRAPEVNKITSAQFPNFGTVRSAILKKC